MRNGSINRKQKNPTKYKWSIISLKFYPTTLEPSEINFPAYFTSEIDLGSFFPIPVPPCQLSKLIGIYTTIIIFWFAVKLNPSIRQGMILNGLLASGLFLSFSCTISSTLLIVHRIHNSLSNEDNHYKKRFMHIVHVLVQSAAMYSLASMVAAIAGVVLVTSRDNTTLSMFAVQTYEGTAILFFFSVRTFGA